MDTNWQGCLSTYLQSIYDRSGSESSREIYRSTLARFFAHSQKSPDAVSRADVLAFIQSPSSAKCNPGGTASASTKNQRLCVLRSFYRYASEYEIDGVSLYQHALPTRGISYLKRTINPRAMTPEEFERFIAAIPTDTPAGQRDRALFLLYFWLGRRRSELYRLQWKDIQPAIVVDPDGTRRPGYRYHYTGKGKSRQTIAKELPAPAWDILHSYLEQSGRLATIQPDEYIFPPTRPGQGRKRDQDDRLNQPLNGVYIDHLFTRYCKLAGLSPDFTLHSLRHMAARERYEAGSDLRTVQQFLDHSSIATTDLYLRVLAGTSDPGASLLEKRFGHLGRL